MSEQSVHTFFQENQEYLSHWHPGLGVRVLQQSFNGLTENEVVMAQRQLLQGVPLAYAIGFRFFYDAEFAVDNRVLIPRVESELIIELVQEKRRDGQQVLVDVGTGSGCLGLSCGMQLPDLTRIILMDISSEALQVAALNRERLFYRLPPNLQVELRQTDCLQEIPFGDIVIANPPYVRASMAREQMHPQVYRYEPHQALFIEDNDYQDWYQALFSRVEESLSEGGLFVMEGEEGELPELLLQFQQCPKRRLRERESGLEKDLTGRERFLWVKF